MDLIPIFYSGQTIIVCHKLDYRPAKDVLVTMLSLDKGTSYTKHSLQRYLKFGFYDEVINDKVENFQQDILKVFSSREVEAFENNLLVPNLEEIQSLCWVPPRLRHQIDINDENYKYKLDDY